MSLLLTSMLGGAGGGSATPVYEHDFGADNQVGVSPVDIFESGKSYVIVGRDLARDPNDGTFASLSIDFILSNLSSGGSFKLLRTRNQSSSTSLQQSALTNRATFETGMNFNVDGECADFVITVRRPNNDDRGYPVFKWEFTNWSNVTNNIVDDGKSFGGLNTLTLTAITGFTFPALGNSPLIQGTIKVYDMEDLVAWA